MSLTYSSYLKLDKLLSLQEPLAQGRAHDEMLFIVIHQAYELWFKEILHELDFLRALIDKGELPEGPFLLKRAIAIFRVFIAHLDVLETMLPSQFLSFRDHLGTASGFQSPQFRELEFIMGFKRPEVMRAFPERSAARDRVEQRYQSPTLWDAFLRCLKQKGYDIPRAVLERDVTQPAVPSPQVQRVLLDLYFQDHWLAFFCELLLDLDEGFQEWRYRHVKMVERMIGGKYGTGGSSGAEYLKGTLFKPSFPDLWAIRTEFRHDANP
jgi:tryptophan 2,3-dioxygenase